MRLDDDEGMIRRLAYRLSEEAGFPLGRDKDFWFEAIRIMESADRSTDSCSQRLRRDPNPLDFERRFAFRVALPPGKMIVIGLTEDGREFQESVLDVSIHGLRFGIPMLSVKSVQKIFWPEECLTLEIANAEIFRKTDKDIVMTISSFKEKTKGKMKWMELINSIKV
ncbi:MAG: DUF2934 domain-containing protein [Magnetococcales bacterium]|nr:DUF2934 domain-containing protein [Magnetococcales bacterium]